MRLPDSFLDELRHRLTLSQVVGRKVTWDLKKTNQARGDWWAPCPFHHEKTASFHVEDTKGFYYCFGCHAKGNLFRFVQETENVGFMEAVEILAREAGMAMPARDPRAAEKADRRTVLAEACEAASRFFRTQLDTRAGSEARDYLRGRGLHPETLDRFEIGYAPVDRQGRDMLRRHLMNKGVDPNVIEGAGLATPPQGPDAPRDRFLDRITFPIRDGRGRLIGFGGRAMNSNAKAKYLNSPETELFDKGSNLYNLAPARTAVGKGAPLIVAEGYMDVIALAQAGIDGAVAPLGTAVTERQLRMLWRVSPEPVVALDGDTAGRRAGLRLADLALPMIEAGQSLRFALLPEGQDPDDLIRSEGADAVKTLITGAQPMARLLWERTIEGRVLDSPERRAGLAKDLYTLVKQISDPTIRKNYTIEFKRLQNELLGVSERAQSARVTRMFSRNRAMLGATDAARNSSLARRSNSQPKPKSHAERARFSSSSDAVTVEAEQVVLAGLILHPGLIEDVADALERARWSNEAHDRLAGALLALDPVSSSDEAMEKLQATPRLPSLEPLCALAHVRITPAGRRGADDEAAMACIRDALARLDARHGADRERDEALEAFAHGEDAGPDETLTWRLAQAARRRDAASKVPQGESGDETERRAAQIAQLDSLLDTLDREKTRDR